MVLHGPTLLLGSRPADAIYEVTCHTLFSKDALDKERDSRSNKPRYRLLIRTCADTFPVDASRRTGDLQSSPMCPRHKCFWAVG